MMDTPDPKKKKMRMSPAKEILATGIPLEMAVYDFCPQALTQTGSNGEFTALNEVCSKT